MSGQTKKTTNRSNSTRSTGNSTRNHTGNHRTSKGNHTKNRQNQQPQKDYSAIYREVFLWIVLAVCAILFISNFGLGGTIGGALSGCLFGLFGLTAYLFPILLFIGVLFMTSNHSNWFAWLKLIAGFLFLCFLCLFLELVSGTDDYSAVSAWAYSREYHNGGGFFGGLLSWLLCPSFGRVCAYVIDFIMLIITMVIVTERSAWKHVKRSGERVYESAKEGNARLLEMQELRREERKLKRMEKKVSGVSADTKLTEDTCSSSDAIKEIRPNTDIKKKKEIPEETAEPTVGQAQILPTVTEQNQVALQPIGKDTDAASGKEAVAEQSKKEEMPIFSPQLQELFAMPEEVEEEPIVAVAPMSHETVELQPKPKDPAQETMTDLVKDVVPEQAPAEQIQPRTPVKNPKQDDLTKENGILEVEQEIAIVEQEAPKQYVFPPIDLLTKGDARRQGDSKQHLQDTAMKLQQTLKNFGVNVTISDVSCGPTVTRYEIQPEMGVKVSKIVNLTDDIKLNLAAADIRMEAPIPGKAAIGIEIPNKETVPVMFRDLVESKEFQEHPSGIAFAAGRDIAGQVIMADIAKMPHLLIAGATGSGKSVCINTIIMSIIYKANPNDVKLIMIDPKVVELSVYNGIPHLFIPVVTDPKKAAGALNWAVAEMTERYQKFAEYGVRDLKGYNAKVESIKDIDDPQKPKKLPQLVIIVDELADLMMVAPGDVEDAICRLAQLARACGIHLIIATQRPSVNVITGLIKANMPSRIAFSVTSGVDSRTILDMTGAEKLLGKGDMLFYPQGLNKPLRVQGAFVSDKEVADVVAFISNSYGAVTYDSSVEEKMAKISEGTGKTSAAAETNAGGTGDGRDAYFVDAAKLLLDKDKASIGMLQRYFKIGFNRAARIMDQLEEAGVVGPEEGTKPRQILVSPEQFENMLEEGL